MCSVAATGDSRFRKLTVKGENPPGLGGHQNALDRDVLCYRAHQNALHRDVLCGPLGGGTSKRNGLLEASFPSLLPSFSTTSKDTSEPHPSHLRAISKPHLSHIRATSEVLAEVKVKEVASTLDVFCSYKPATQDCFRYKRSLR